MPQITIPETITVHLGSPRSNAENLVVPFSEYIKNVASHEIYPTWPEEAIRANVLAQISYALNRIYTEWYPSMGYDFDITNDTRYDQSYRKGGNIFDNVSEIVDDIFNNYIVKDESVLPYFSAYCDGRYTMCDGLRQWETVTLANQGLSAEEILKRFYGDNINIVYNANIEDAKETYPGMALRIGSLGNEVYLLQRQLNRIRQNYPAIPYVEPSGYFGINTERAVREFQRIFNLEQDGIVGKSTWYAIRRIFNGVMGLAELYGEPIAPEDIEERFEEIRLGSTGVEAQTVAYYLQLIATFDDDVPYSQVENSFSENNVTSLKAFQTKRGLEPTGVVDRETWNELVRAYNAILINSPENIKDLGYEVYPGRLLSYGMTGEDITALQNLLRKAAANDNTIPPVNVTGTFDDDTLTAVREIQQREGLQNNGVVGPILWSRIVELSR